MNLQKVKEQILTKKDIHNIKTYCHFIDIGSEISCYNITSKQVIKIFDVTHVDTSKKLLIPDRVYGTDTYLFADAVQIYCNKIFSYTMKYVKGARLGKEDSIILFYNLSYDLLLKHIETLVNDSKTIANQGIQAFDCFENNIILSNNGFKQIDCVDFFEKDIDPSIITKENIRLMCQTIWDSLIVPRLSIFISNNNLNQADFCQSPYEFIIELKRISEKLSDTEIITLNDTKKLIRRK